MHASSQPRPCPPCNCQSDRPPNPIYLNHKSTPQVKTEAQADELLARLDGGADFGEVAMVESECPSKQQGGDLGWFGAGQMVGCLCWWVVW